MEGVPAEVGWMVAIVGVVALVDTPNALIGEMLQQT